MSSKNGTIVLMGSGELTATMVQVHKDLLAADPDPPKAVFLDTPAGFQLNVDQLSQRVVAYFHSHIQRPVSVVSFKSSETANAYEVGQACQSLKQADYILIGPGSPTYALRQWQRSPVPKIIIERIKDSGCLVAASAAALTVGSFTLPVYEIYKVGQDLHWVEGLNILGHFGLNLVVVPHWNNAEGSTHDTRFCYMGESRFKKLEALLPKDVSILGLDEHTACLIDLDRETFVIKGIGSVTLRRQGDEICFKKGAPVPLEVLRNDSPKNIWIATSPSSTASAPLPALPDSKQGGFWENVHEIESTFHCGLKNNDSEKMTNAILDLDKNIWKAHQDLEDPEFISQGREMLRELIVLLGTRLTCSHEKKIDCLVPLLDELLELRERFRRDCAWELADTIRKAVAGAGIIIDDTKDGARWRFKK